MKKYFFLIALSIFLFIKSFAYDCKTRLSYQDFERSDLVFTGRVFEVDMEKRLYRMKVIEILKGETSDTITLSMRDKWSTTIYPKEYEYWLIFADHNKYETFSSACTYSTRLNEYPYFPLVGPRHPNEQMSLSSIQSTLGDISRYLVKELELNKIERYSIKENTNKKIDEQNLLIKELKEGIFIQQILSVIIILFLSVLLIKKSRAKT
jgi:hypothetical protein